MNDQKEWSELPQFIFIPLVILAMMIISSCTAGGERNVEDPQEPGATIDSAGKSDEDQMDDNDAENDGQIVDQQPAPMTRSDRLTPPSKPPASFERVPELNETPVVGEVPQEIMELVIADVSDKADAGKESINVLRAEHVVWPDGSLGCAKPGEIYTQAQVPGYWVILDADNVTFDYRITEQGYFMYCEKPGSLIKPGDLGGTPEM